MIFSTEDSFTKKEIIVLSGLTARQIQFYVDENIVEPGIYNAEGRGHVRKYSAINILEFRIIKEFVDARISVSIVRKIMNVFIRELYYIAYSSDKNKCVNDLFDELSKMILIVYRLRKTKKFHIKLKPISEETILTVKDLNIFNAIHLVLNLEVLLGENDDGLL